DMKEVYQDVDQEALPLTRRAEFSYWLRECFLSCSKPNKLSLGHLLQIGVMVYSKTGSEICDLLLSAMGEGASRVEQFSCFDTAFSFAL
ncbi:hypothetical protein S245_027411, partial [Arachis hypogaea]